MTASRSNFTIEGHSIFEDAEGSLIDHAMNKPFIELPTVSFFHSNDNFNSRTA
ncbi:MAG: hypothetical protein CLLPBCKN_008219 [Chroococcidiopsis cubana SAG 39.79]|nr:hypothetical protein [Chroococcidiopsis cubana SAG 39.79]